MAIMGMCISEGKTGSAYNIGTHVVSKLCILDSADERLRTFMAIVH